MVVAHSDQGSAERTVVGVDGSPGAREALVWALRDAARRRTSLEVVSSFPVELRLSDPFVLDEAQLESVREDTLQRARAQVEEVRGETGQTGVPVDVLAVAGPPVQMLLAASEDAGRLVVGSRGRGAVRSLVLGSVALSSVTHARVPVVVVHTGAEEGRDDGPARVVVGLDGSEASGTALERAGREAELLGAELVAVAAYSVTGYWSDAYAVALPPPEQLAGEVRDMAEQQVAEARVPDGVPVRIECLEGPAGDVLTEAAQGARLLVVGGHGQGAVRGLLMGSVALHCVLAARCPVMVVPESGGSGRHVSA